MKEKRTGIRYRILAGVIFFMAVFIVWPSIHEAGLVDSATDLQIVVNKRGQDSDETSDEDVNIAGTGYTMRAEEEMLVLKGTMLTDKRYKAIWTVESGSEFVKLEDGSTPNLCKVVAIKPGDADISVQVILLDSDGNEDYSVTIPPLLTRIYVRFGITTAEKYNFRKITPKAERESLFLKSDIGSVAELKLNYGNSEDSRCTWISDDEDVVTVEGGKVTVRGAGRTKVHASYLPEGAVTPLTDAITVYVMPKITNNDEDKTNNISVHSNAQGECLKTNTTFTKNGGSIKDKIEWVITSADTEGASQIIEDTIGGKKSDDIELEPSLPDRELKTVAKAGIYDIYFFPKGVYEASVKEGVPLSDMMEFCRSVKLYVYGEFSDKKVYLNTGDSYDILEALNVTKAKFLQLFSGVDTTSDPDTLNVISYDESTLTCTAKQIGDAQIKLKIENAVHFAYIIDKPVPSDGYFYINIHVSDGIQLDRSNVTLAVGAKLQLRETTGATDGTFEWTTSASDYVSVDKNGLITAKRITQESNDVKITLTQRTTNGKVRRAVCMVRVVSTVTNIRLNYEKVNLEVDKTITVLATFQPNVNTAPIKWITNEEDIVNISVANDKKSIVVTGKKPGTAVITAVNTDNFITASVTVNVVCPIKTVTLNKSELTVSLSQEIVRLKATYLPTDATSTDLVWASSNAAVASVNEDGVVSLLQAGTVVISVRPAYNPYLTMAQCTINVLQSAVGFQLTTSEMVMEVGDSNTLKYVMQPAGATTKTFFRSMDPSVATVSASGKVTAVGPGKTYIVASTDNGFTSTCTIIVTKAATGVTLDVYHLTIAVGDTYKVTAMPNPVNSTEKTFTWKSKDPSIATVNASGKVTGIKAGETIITVKTKKGDVEYLYVTVYDQVTSMKLNYARKTIDKGKKFTLKAIFTPANASNKKVKWSSSNTKVASVTSKGVVSGLRGGVAIITAVSEDGGYVATCIVTVKQPVTIITLNKSSYTLGIGKSIALKATVKSKYSSKQTLKWTSSNVKVATVSKRGVVTGKKLGTVTIKCRATDGSGEYATCKIRVVRQATKITLNKTTIKMLVGNTTKIRAKVKPSNASYKTVKWSSSNESVASIDTNGNITALSVGSCKIVATAKDNSKKKAYCLVYVSKAIPSTGVTISEKDMVLVKGTSSMLAYSISPNNTTDKVKFYSDNKKVATVSSTGRVSARKPGAATITIRTSSGKVGMVNVTVVGLNRTNIVMGQYERIELWVEEKASGVRWYSENASVASVVNGSVVSRKRGKTRIVAIVDGIRLYCNVTVL